MRRDKIKRHGDKDLQTTAGENDELLSSISNLLNESSALSK